MRCDAMRCDAVRCGAIQAGTSPGLELDSFEWQVQPLEVQHIESSFFDDPEAFTDGSAEFDSALLMRGIPHRWVAHEPMRQP